MYRALLLLTVSTLFAQNEPITLASLRYTDLVVGTGAPAAAGKKFTVHYTGRLTDGTKFDSSLDRNEPLSFVQGRRQVIAGWDMGFEGMKVGGKRKLFIPYQLAYGEAGSGPIPPKAELIFDVELLGVSDAPTTAPAVDVLAPYIDLEAKVMALARSAPDPLSKIFAHIFVRIIALNESTLEAAAMDSPVLEEIKADPVIEGRDKIVERLAASFAAVRRRLESARNGSLTGDATLFGKANTRRGLFTALDEAIGEQYGQAIAAR